MRTKVIWREILWELWVTKITGIPRKIFLGMWTQIMAQKEWFGHWELRYREEEMFTSSYFTIRVVVSLLNNCSLQMTWTHIWCLSCLLSSVPRVREILRKYCDNVVFTNPSILFPHSLTHSATPRCERRPIGAGISLPSITKPFSLLLRLEPKHNHATMTTPFPSHPL